MSRPLPPRGPRGAAALLAAATALLLAAPGSLGAQPATEPEPLAPGTLSTEANDYNPSLAPDGRLLVFARSEPEFRNARIFISRLRGGRWSEPEPAPFTDARFSDTDPTLSPDGRTLYFASDRPAAGRDSTRRDLDVWRVRREGSGWGTPEHLGGGVNTRAQELGPSFHDGWLYFGSTRGGRARMLDVFRARETAGGWGAAEAMDAWNTAASEGDPEFSPDGSHFFFWSDRPGSLQGDLYVSRRTADGWSVPTPVAAANSAGFDFTPEVSPDGRWLYFSSTRPAANAQSNLYRIPLR